ncbi:MAG: UbiD family decarboxylase [Bacteroidia bacterium]|nr:UbiD family decarboxylase [Bacteroidia bacterium]MCC6769381.1 UbiD family decarboxylase [Bacteroidia bacterium]
MGYNSLAACIADLEKHKHLVRIKQEVDPVMEMAAIHLRVFEAGGPAILFERVKGSQFPAVSNLFGTTERSRFIFRDTYTKIQQLIRLKNKPMEGLRHPIETLGTASLAWYALPKRQKVKLNECRIGDLPQIKHWPQDGGAFITLPAVYTEDPDQPGLMHSNLGMYRIQLSGNSYVQDKEIGLHYQLHRGIGVHQTGWQEKGKPMKVSIFVGGPPALPFSAVMPLPEGMPELSFAGALNRRRFRYFYDAEGFCVSSDADFTITGEVFPGELKPEGPFGDHLGYYSLTHDFPMMRVHKVYHKKGAIWPFTVVGRPPQEDTAFGNLIHDLTGDALTHEIPGLKEIHAVDAAGVHPLLLAIGSERYTPYQEQHRPSELLTIANRILGTGQLSLAKWLFIASGNAEPQLDTHDEPAFFMHILERIDPARDLHFHTQTSIDTLDYSGEGLNTGSKVVIAATGKPVRVLGRELPDLVLPEGFMNMRIVFAGVLVLEAKTYREEPGAAERLASMLPIDLLNTFPLIVICDDASFTSKSFSNWAWVTFTRSNPSHDIFGVAATTLHKHWGCKGSLLIDARIKPHHAPPLEKDEVVERSVDQLGVPGGPLHGII